MRRKAKKGRGSPDEPTVVGWRLGRGPVGGLQSLRPRWPAMPRVMSSRSGKKSVEFID